MTSLPKTSVALGRTVRTVPVVDAGRRVVVSDTDLIELRRVGRVRAGRAKEWRYVTREGTARTLMTAPAVTVAPETAVTYALRRMIADRVPCMPVVEPGGRLVGVVIALDRLHPLGYAIATDSAAGH